MSRRHRVELRPVGRRGDGADPARYPRRVEAGVAQNGDEPDWVLSKDREDPVRARLRRCAGMAECGWKTGRDFLTGTDPLAQPGCVEALEAARERPEQRGRRTAPDLDEQVVAWERSHRSVHEFVEIWRDRGEQGVPTR